MFESGKSLNENPDLTFKQLFEEITKGNSNFGFNELTAYLKLNKYNPSPNDIAAIFRRLKVMDRTEN